MQKIIDQSRNLLYTHIDRFGKITVSLVMLFPIFGMTIRHWLSGTYSLLVCVSLFALYQQKQKLYKEEKILFYIFVLFLTSFTLSATLNHWSVNSVHRLGQETKFLFFFPFYLLIRRYPQTLYALVLGTIAASTVLLLQTLIQFLFLTYKRGDGIYGYIIFGDLSILYFSLLMILYIIKHDYIINSFLLLFASASSFIVGILSGTRNAWIAALASILLLFFLARKKINLRYLIAILLSLIIISAFLFVQFPKMGYRLHLAFQQTYTYFTQATNKNENLVSDSVGYRLEQWRAALMIFKEAPLFGFGAGNAGKEVNRMAKAGRVNSTLYNKNVEVNIGGLHNTYFESLVNEGLFGLAIMFLFLFYPLYIFFKVKRHDKALFSLGILFTTNFLIFGLTENPFDKDNFTSVYLTYMAVFFSVSIHKMYLKSENNSATPIQQ